MKKNTAFLLFVLGIAVTFTFITLLQFVDAKEKLWLFICVLVLMHAGIVCFIFSKKAFKKTGETVKTYFSQEYFFLLWYLPVLFAKIFLPLFTSLTFDAGTPEYYVKLGSVLTMSLIFAVLSVFNAIALRKQIAKNEEQEEK